MLGALLGKDSGWHPKLWLAGPAIVIWSVGLVAAAFSVRHASAQQSKISAAQRMMREALEEVLYGNIAETLSGSVPSLDEEKPLHEVWRAVRPWRAAAKGGDAAAWFYDTYPSPDERQVARKNMRKQLRGLGAASSKRSTRAWWRSVIAFVLGAALALASVLWGVNVGSHTVNSTKPARVHVAPEQP